MLAKYTIAGVAGSVLLASIAFAQSPTATTDKMKAGTASDTSATSSSFQGNWRASKMVGLNVYNDNNESVGSINDMLTDKTGSVKSRGDRRRRLPRRRRASGCGAVRQGQVCQRARRLQQCRQLTRR